MTNLPDDGTRPDLMYRESTLVNVAEREIELTQDETDYFGSITLDYTQGSNPQVFNINPVEMDIFNVTIDPNGGTINEDYRITEVEEGENYTLLYSFQLELERTGYSLSGYTVEGTLLNAEGEPVTQINRFTAEYTPESNVTLTANWEVTTGDFNLRIYDDELREEQYDAVITNTETGVPENISLTHLADVHYAYDDEVMPYGTYNLSIDGYNITSADIRGWQIREQPEMHEDGSITFFLDFQPNYSANHSTLDLEVKPIPETHPLGIEVRDLDGLRTSDVTIYVQNEEFVVFRGSFNEYAQWITEEELPVGEYTITLQTPENMYAIVQDTTQQHAVPTERQNVFTILVNEENRGSLSRVFAAFQLVEMEFHLGVEIRGLDGRRTNDVTVYVQDEEFVVFEGSYNEYNQWLTEAELPAGEYTITLDTPDNTQAVINDTTSQYAVPTDRSNVFTIELNETNLGTSSAIYGTFQLEEMEFHLGVEVRGLDGKRTSDVVSSLQMKTMKYLKVLITSTCSGYQKMNYLLVNISLR